MSLYLSSATFHDFGRIFSLKSWSGFFAQTDERRKWSKRSSQTADLKISLYLTTQAERLKSISIALCVFGKRGRKMFNFELLFLHGFSSKNREILHKTVLTPQEYEDYFFGKKIKKKMGENIQKTCWGCLCKLRLVSKKSSHKKNFFLEKALFEETPPSSKKMGF